MSCFTSRRRRQAPSCGREKAAVERKSLMMDALARFLRIRPKQSLFLSSDNEAVYGEPEKYPTFPPAPPRVILEDPVGYKKKVQLRRYSAPRGEFEDNSLYALYRLYECFVLDHRCGYRNFLEHFWRQPTWIVSEIEPPDARNDERYAFIACVTYLMVEAFNARVELGLERDGPALLSPEEAERLRNKTEDEKAYECVPAWAISARRLDKPLFIPTEHGLTITDERDKRLDENFLSKNIYIWKPHILFT